MELIICFVLGILSQLLVMTSGCRLNKEFKGKKETKKIQLSPLWQLFLLVKKEDSQNGVQRICLVYHILAYFLSLTSIVFFIVALITNGANETFLSVVVSFVLMAFSTVIFIIEMIIWFIVDVRSSSDWEE